jgi:hypothetical protein
VRASTFHPLDSQRKRLLFGVGGGLAALVIIGAAVFASQALSPVARDASLKEALTAAILTDKTVVVLPAGNSAGHMSASAVAEMRDRLARVLPTVYTGALLTVKLQRLSAYIDNVASSENFGENTAAGVTNLTMEARLVSASHATISGSYTIWLTGRHIENGKMKNDRIDATYAYTAGLDQVNGAWLVSSWDEQQVA